MKMRTGIFKKMFFRRLTNSEYKAKMRILKTLVKKVFRGLFVLIENLLIVTVIPVILTLHFMGWLDLGTTIILYCLACLVFFIFQYVDKRYSFSLNFPIPEEWFTKEDEYGEVTVEKDRLQELILYVNDVEKFIVQNGLKQN